MLHIVRVSQYVSKIRILRRFIGFIAMQSNKISVIVPVYNVLPYIEKCLNSLVCQTYKNLEIIVVDDGSNDGSEKICDEFAKKHKSITVFHKKNGGLSSARNFGLAHVTGDYIGFVDSDDYVEPNMFEKMLKTAINSNLDICVCSFVREQENLQSHVALQSLEVKNIEYFKLFAKKESMPYVVVWNKLFKANLFNNLQFPEDKIHEDQWVIHYALKDAKKVGLISDELYHYTDRENGISKGSNFSKHFDDYDAIFDRIELLKKMGCENMLGYCDEHLANISRFYIGEMHTAHISNEDIKLLKSYLKKCQEFSKWCLENGIINEDAFLKNKKIYNFNFVKTIKMKIKNFLNQKKIKGKV